MPRSLHLRCDPHAVRPLRRRARAGAPRRSRRDSDQGADGAQSEASTGARSTTSSTAAPTRPARTTATSRGWRCCSPGLPQEVPGATINRLCGSSLDAIAHRRARDQERRDVADDRRRRRKHDARAVRDGQGRLRVLARREDRGHDDRLALRQSADEEQVRHRLDAGDGGERARPNSRSAAPIRTRSRCAASSAPRPPSPRDGWPRRSCR